MLFLYPQFVEPPLAPIPSLVDEWMTAPVIPPKPATSRASGAVYVEPLPLRSVTQGDWSGFDDIPPKRVTPRQFGLDRYVEPLPLRTVVADWITYEEAPPRRAVPRALGAIYNEPLPLRNVTLGDWQGYEDAPPKRVAPRPLGLTVCDPAFCTTWFVAPATVFPEAWARQPEIRVRATVRGLGERYVEPLPLRTVTLADWQGSESVQMPPAKPRQAGIMLCDPTAYRQVLVSSWFSQIEYHRKSPTTNFYSEVVLPINVSGASSSASPACWYYYTMIGHL